MINESLIGGVFWSIYKLQTSSKESKETFQNTFWTYHLKLFENTENVFILLIGIPIKDLKEIRIIIFLNCHVNV